MNQLFLSLKVQNFRNYLFGSFISEIGNQMQVVAVAWQVYELTGNPVSLGLIGVANFLPIILFSLLGGVVADKIDRKILLVVSQGTQALLALTLFVLTFLNLINPWYIYLILFLVATAQSFSIPARQAVLPHLVPKEMFMNAVSLATMQFQSANMIGPAIAGFLIGGMGVSAVYFTNSLSFIVFIGVLLGIKASFQKHDRENVELNLSSVWEGIRFVVSKPILYLTMILDFLATFFGTTTILMPIFAKDILHVGAGGLGFLYSAPAIGGIIAGLLVAAIHHRIHFQGRVIVLAVMLYGAATIAFGLSKSFYLSLFFLGLVGFGDMVSTIIRNTIRQMVTPDYLRGRMASVTRIFFQGGPQLGEIEGGFLARLVGAPASVIVGGAGVIIITGLIFIKSKALRDYRPEDLSLEKIPT